MNDWGGTKSIMPGVSICEVFARKRAWHGRSNFWIAQPQVGQHPIAQGLPGAYILCGKIFLYDHNVAVATSQRSSERGCLIAFLALLVPRVLMFLVFLATNWFGRAFDTRLWPLLGFFFMPYTTLAYMAAMLNNNHALSGGWLVIFIVAILVDAGHWGGGGSTYRRRSHETGK